MSIKRKIISLTLIQTKLSMKTSWNYLIIMKDQIKIMLILNLDTIADQFSQLKLY